MAINIPVDFTGVESKASVRVKPGDYVVKVVKVDKKNASSGNPMLVVTFEGMTGELKGKRLTDRHILIKDSLWTLRNMLEAMGFKVKPSKMKLSDSMLMNKQVGVTVIDGDEYKGRIRSEIADYIPKSAVGNMVTGEDAEEIEEEDDPFADFEEEDEEEVEDGDEEIEEEDEAEEEEESDESFDFNDEEEDDEETEDEELSFTLEDVSSAKGAELKTYLAEAMEAGWEFDLDDKPKVAEVREALASLFEGEEEDDDEMEGFSLDDME